MRHTLFFLLVIPMILGCTTSKSDRTIVLSFDEQQTVSSRRVSLDAFSDTMPSDWSGFKYMVMELRTNTSQTYFFGVNTEWGYNEVRVNFYAPGEWIRTAIPLEYMSEEPAKASSLSALYNHKRELIFINQHFGTRGPLVGVDSIGFRIHHPTGNPKLEIRSLYLSNEDPGDEYLGSRPNVDEYGQWALGEFEGKIHNDKELLRDWAVEDSLLAMSQEREGLSKYGGLTSLKSRATGYFRTEKIDGRWWFIDPEGNYFISLGADCMAAQMESRASIMRYGADGEEKANRKIIERARYWGLNTIANWSSQSLIALNRMPYAIQLRDIGFNTGVLGLPDVYASDFEKKSLESLRSQLDAHKDNPYLLGYFIANEPAWNRQESRLVKLISELPDTVSLKMAFNRYLEKRGDTEQNRLDFVFDTFDRFLDITIRNLKKVDPNHLTLGIRFGAGSPRDEILRICGKHFDVYSLNAYVVAPDDETLNHIAEVTGKPIIGGEYHFGTVDRGLGMSLVKVDSQKERGQAFRYYTEQGFANPNLIGLAYFQWNDQPILGRKDGENYNIGLVDVTDRPYPHMAEAIRETSALIYDIHLGMCRPFDRKTGRTAVMGTIPDIF